MKCVGIGLKWTEVDQIDRSRLKWTEMDQGGPNWTEVDWIDWVDQINLVDWNRLSELKCYAMLCWCDSIEVLQQ